MSNRKLIFNYKDFDLATTSTISRRRRKRREKRNNNNRIIVSPINFNTLHLLPSLSLRPRHRHTHHHPNKEEGRRIFVVVVV
jgi:hypothetical protein